jgi:hypothetical protein
VKSGTVNHDPSFFSRSSEDLLDIGGGGLDMQLVEARMQRSCKLLSLSKLGRRALGPSGREDEPVCHPSHVFWVQDRIFFLVSTAHVVVARYPVEYEVLHTIVLVATILLSVNDGTWSRC